jgi:hypothetical protein
MGGQAAGLWGEKKHLPGLRSRSLLVQQQYAVVQETMHKRVEEIERQKRMQGHAGGANSCFVSCIDSLVSRRLCKLGPHVA